MGWQTDIYNRMKGRIPDHDMLLSQVADVIVRTEAFLPLEPKSLAQLFHEQAAQIKELKEEIENLRAASDD
jgi:hypothetical protein